MYEIRTIAINDPVAWVFVDSRSVSLPVCPCGSEKILLQLLIMFEILRIKKMACMMCRCAVGNVGLKACREKMNHNNSAAR